MWNINKKIKFTILLLFSAIHQTSVATTKITVWDHTVNDPTEIIMDTLLRALEITKPEYGDYQLITSIEMEQGRALRELSTRENSHLDLAHFAPTREREEQAIVVRIPLIQGLLGYRICLIKQGEQYKFSQITNKQQWLASDLSIGQHKNWPDTLVLQNNGLNVKTTYKYELLFQQLVKNRFDCFARGANEINYEQRNHRNLNLEIEKTIILHYPFPMFFFVNKNNPSLAKRLELGLSRLMEDGTSAQLFEHYYRTQIEDLNLKNRHIIELNNPTLSKKTIQAMRQPNVIFQQRYLVRDITPLRSKESDK
ncbi:transporter substrate-binding domain-containing protein [Psychromonas hadalis]|uniref:transporter substrate-binding domain-containing protein n=1 Tax=Psychromonas hadalis TaxID=211669 RepID=UPI0003B6906E|nr:transporter substrate-binding domain-containing protein [Psychromonas hadalis]